MYIGQTNSFNSLNLLQLNEQKSNSTIVFTDIKIFNQVFPHTGPILSGDKIKLDYTQNMISIEFALLSYLNSYDNLYKWKLEGMEKEWNISKNNTATYTNLIPGNYTLVVWAANSNGEWTKAPIRLFFTISPPFYKTWWFITLCILAIASLIYWMVQSRINRIREKYSLRNSIASDLHDEIGSTLTSIHILSTVSQQAMEKAPLQAKEMLAQIAIQSKTVQQNMSDIVWSIRPDNEQLASLVTRFREYAAQTLEPLNIQTTITVDDSILQKNLEPLLKKELLLIYKEAINNISKHSGASAASITLKKNGGNITMVISDNGIWKGNNSGTGTKTMQERAKTIGGIFVINTDSTGTTITLSIPIP
jgi:signal transduction histidine kinase